MSIFLDVAPDPAPIRAEESEFEHLSRRAGDDWGRVRTVVSGWWTKFGCANMKCPDREWNKTFSEFRDKKSFKFRSSFWEVYLASMFLELGFKVHREAGRPDFHLSRSSDSVWVEATTIDEEQEIRRAHSHLGNMLDFINKDVRLRKSGFLLDYDPISTSPDTPSLKGLCDRLVEWLASLNSSLVNQNLALRHEDCREEEGCLEYLDKDWHLRFWAIPRQQGVAVNHVIGPPNPSEAWMRSDSADIRTALTIKGRKYGEKCQPLMIAVMSPRHTNEHEVASALFGSAWEHPDMIRRERIAFGPPGYWLDRNGPTHHRVSAVLFCTDLSPYTIATAQPEIWHNPWAAHSLGDVFPFRSLRVNTLTGNIESVEPSRPAHSILGLWPGWPREEGEEPGRG